MIRITHPINPSPLPCLPHLGSIKAHSRWAIGCHVPLRLVIPIFHRLYYPYRLGWLRRRRASEFGLLRGFSAV